MIEREDIYIEVTPDTIGAYATVLQYHGEKSIVSRKQLYVGNLTPLGS